MYSLEICFRDSPTVTPETLFVRRHSALIGGNESAHVVIDDLKASGAELHLTRSVGRRFRGEIRYPGKESKTELFEDFGKIDLDSVSLHIIALDIDLLPKEDESLDRSGVRLLKTSVGRLAPKFPALVFANQKPALVVSFHEGQSVTIGRGRTCQVRVDPIDVSTTHARVGFEDGLFWIEDLGSTNGTFVGEQQVSGRVSVNPGTQMQIGFETTMIGVASEADLKALQSAQGLEFEQRPPTLQRSAYPAIISLSEVARPARVLMTRGAVLKVGRDPASDMWIGVPHVSRVHCTFQLTEDGGVIVRDQSTNGTAVDGDILKRGATLESKGDPKVFELGGGVTVGLCFSSEDEDRYTAAGGARSAFEVNVPQKEILTSAGKGNIAAESGQGSTISEPQDFSSTRRKGGRTQRIFTPTVLLIAAVLSGIIALVVVVTLLAPLVFS